MATAKAKGEPILNRVSHRLASLDPASTPLGVEPVAEPGHVPRLVIVAEGVEGLVPGGQHFPGGQVEVVAGRLVPDRQLVPVVLDDGGGGPPDLVVGGGGDAADLGAGDSAAQGEVDVRGQSFCGSTAAKYWTS
jgi:hypothetical protein